MSDLTDRISTDALKPQTVSNDGVTVSQRSLQDQIEAAKFEASHIAAASPTEVMRAMQMRLVPPGGV